MFKRILSCPFGGRQKVQVTKFAFDDFVFVVGNLLRTRSAQRLSSQYFAAVPTPNIAELVPSGFFCRQHGFCGGPNTFFSEKHPPVYSTDLRTRILNVVAGWSTG